VRASQAALDSDVLVFDSNFLRIITHYNVIILNCIIPCHFFSMGFCFYQAIMVLTLLVIDLFFYSLIKVS